MRLATLLRRIAGRPAPHPYPEQFAPDMDRPLFEGRPRWYLIASTPRCGSHFLGHALIETGHFGVPLEYLHRGNLDHWRRRFGSAAPEALLGEIIRRRTDSSGWFGLKAHWSQFAPTESQRMLTVLGDPACAVFLYRRDLLGQAISFLRAEQTGQWISGAPARGDARYEHRALLDCAGRIRDQNEAWTAFLAERFTRPVLPVVYEELLGGAPASLARVMAFIDPAAPAQPVLPERTRRQSDGLSKAWRARFTEEAGPGDGWVAAPQEYPFAPEAGE